MTARCRVPPKKSGLSGRFFALAFFNLKSWLLVFGVIGDGTVYQLVSFRSPILKLQ